MRKRIKARELALRLLFQVIVGGLPLEDVLDNAAEAVLAAADDFDYAEELVRGVVANLADLDRTISDYAIGWNLERLARVDRCLLELGIHELSQNPEVPAGICVNDAVELARKYSTEASGRFVNGILGAFLRDRDRERQSAHVEAS